MLHYSESQNSYLNGELTHCKSLSASMYSDLCNLKLQNIYLSRQCLYAFRVSSRLSSDDSESATQLMSIEIDKLKIENRLLQERNEAFEMKQPVSVKHQPDPQLKL